MFFRYDEYRAFLTKVSQTETFTPLGSWDGGPAIVLRHDVDFDLAAAYDLALLEHECGVRSTFFVMTTADSYNPMSATNRARLIHMHALGFEIGIHFHPPAYGAPDATEQRRNLDAEAAVLAGITGSPVRAVSIHNPSVHGGYPIFEGYRNAYEPAIFSPERYLSDSRMILRTDPYEFCEKTRGMSRQILLHPMHFTPQGDAYPSILRRIVRDYATTLDEDLRVNETYVSLMPVGLFDSIANGPAPKG